MSSTALNYLNQFSPRQYAQRAQFLLSTDVDSRTAQEIQVALIDFLRQRGYGDAYSRRCGEFGVPVDNAAVARMSSEYSSTLMGLQTAAGNARANHQVPALLDAYVRTAELYAAHGDVGQAASTLSKAEEVAHGNRRNEIAVAVAYAKVFTPFVNIAMKAAEYIHDVKRNPDGIRPEDLAPMLLFELYHKFYRALQSQVLGLHSFTDVALCFHSLVACVPVGGLERLATDASSGSNVALVGVLATVLALPLGSSDALRQSREVRRLLRPPLADFLAAHTDGRGGSMIAAFDALRPAVAWDAWAGPSAGRLGALAVRRAAADFLRPFAAIAAPAAAAALRLAPPALRDAARDAIVAGELAGRIDAHADAFVADPPKEGGIARRAKRMEKETILQIRAAGIALLALRTDR